MSPQPCAEGQDKVGLDRRVRGGSSRHGNRPQAVELVAEFLLVFPGQELLHSHRATKGDVHAGYSSTAVQAVSNNLCPMNSPVTGNDAHAAVEAAAPKRRTSSQVDSSDNVTISAA